MNRDLIFVTAYCPTKEQLDRLSECVDSLPRDNFDIALISHSHIPLEIQQKCHYYIFDHLNELSDDIELKHFEYHVSKTHLLKTKLLKKTPFYGFSIYRMFSAISNLAKIYNYERIYHVEYDYVIKDKSIFYNHKIFLENYDSVFYTLKHDSDMILGGLKSFRVHSLPYLFANYNRSEMTKLIKENNLNPLEIFTKYIFQKAGKPLFIDSSIVKEKVETKKFPSQNLNWCFCYNQSDNKIYFFYLNLFNSSREIKLKFNQFIIREIVEVNEYRIVEIGDIESIQNLSLTIDTTTPTDFDITEDFKNSIKKYSLIEFFSENN